MKKSLLLAGVASAAVLLQCTSPAPETAESTKPDSTEVQTTESPSIKGEKVTYSTENTEMIGYFAVDQSMDQKRPGLLVVHEWWGQNDYVRGRAEQLAALGYVALAVDMYGEGKTADHPDDAMGFSSSVMKNMEESKARFQAAYKTLSEHPMVDPSKISAVGYCFGGSVALSMANAGMDLDGVAAFHSGVNLPIPPGDDLSARLLVQNGAADPMITAEDAESFISEVNEVGGDLDYVSYDGVVHAYTNPDATKLGETFELPLKYDEEAAEKSWVRMKSFFGEIYR